MSTTVFLLIAFVIVASTTLIVLLDGPKAKRRDDRDAAKSEDLKKNPALLFKSQQPAELQVGEDEEAEHHPGSRPMPRPTRNIQRVSCKPDVWVIYQKERSHEPRSND